jgi:hypothetical protein
MYYKIRQIGIVFFSFLILSTSSFAQSKSEKNSISDINLINITAKQKMLSQRIAKDYLYIGKKVAVSKASRQLKKSLDEFIKTHEKLRKYIKDPDIKNLLDFVSLSSDDLKKTVNKKFSVDNAQLVLDLSESMLEGNQYIVNSLKKSMKNKDSISIIGVVSQQRMLSQRIAKYYIAYQLGIKDKNSVKSMHDTVRKFNDNLNILMKNSTNTPQIDKKLAKINKLWKIVYKFYNNIEKGGLPLIVFNTTDNITKEMDEVTEMFLENEQL